MFKFGIFKILAITLLISLFYPSSIISAQEMETDEDKQEKIENDIRKIGLSAGYAAQCYQQREDENAVERVAEEALSVAEIILQDFGSTLAFLFSSNAGYGTGISIDFTECNELIGDWEEFVDRLVQQQEEE